DLPALAADTARQALNAGGYWLPPDAITAVAAAVMATVQAALLPPILADADHHEQCGALSQTTEGGIAHSGMAAAHRIDAERLRRALTT
ncbi:hypothetical protein HYE82_31290, partial [Streptomyces sp. BR123]|uniref:hypothetical protein n=1 Tax=Streptomyces sp. BR123 TaxID=2749828 RepID=UPI0015C455E8